MDDIVAAVVERTTRDRLARRITQINHTTRDRIRDMTVQAVDEGLSPSEFGRMLRGVVDPLESDKVGQALARKLGSFGSELRAETIARTEMRVAQNAAQLDAFAGLGAREVELIDGDDDPECAARNGRIVTLEEAESIMLAEHPNGTLTFAPAPLDRDPFQPPEQTPTAAREGRDFGRSVDDADAWARTSSVSEALDDDLAEYIRDYTDEGYAYVNAYHRGQFKPKYADYDELSAAQKSGQESYSYSSPTKSQLDRQTRRLDETLRPLDEDVVVYRRVSIDWNDETDPFVSTFGKGPENALLATGVEKGYMSTSLTINDRIAGEYVYRILVPRGTKARWAKPYSAKPSENELLLERDREMTVTGWRTEIQTIHGEQREVNVVEMTLS